MKNILLFLAILCVAPQFAQSQCGLFYDDFESGSLSSAFIPAGGTYTRTVQSSGSPQGSYHMENSGSGSHFSGTYFTFPSSTPSEMSWWVRTSTTSQHSGYMVIGDANITSSYGTIFIYIRNNGSLRFYANSSVDYNFTVAANTWHFIELKNMNYTTFTYDIWVDGVQRTTNFPFRNNTSTIDRAYMYNLGTAVSSYDQISVGGNPVSLASMTTNVNCAGDSNGTAMVTASGGTPQYSYLWNTGDTSSSISNLSAGVYTVMVSDSAGCMKTDSITVTEPSAITSSVTTTAVTCPGGNDGAVDLSASGGTGSYTYSWTTGDTSQDLSNSAAGMYTVTVMDSLGCTHLDTATVMGPSLWNVNVSASDPTCAGNTDGTLSAVVSGATPGYTYSWSTGDTLASIGGLGGGTFTLTIMDSLGCTTTDTSTLAEPLAVASMGVVTDDTSGNSTGAIDLTPSGGTPPFVFSWDNGASTEDLSGLSAGTYIVTITDANGCSHMDTFTVSLFVGIGNPAAGPEMNVFPNPVNDHLQIVISNMPATEVGIQLFDLHGKLIREVNTTLASSVQQEIDMQDLAPGAYFLKVQGEGWNKNIRVLKQ